MALRLARSAQETLCRLEAVAPRMLVKNKESASYHPSSAREKVASATEQRLETDSGQRSDVTSQLPCDGVWSVGVGRGERGRWERRGGYVGLFVL